jgi:hypothetical protein
MLRSKTMRAPFGQRRSVSPGGGGAAAAAAAGADAGGAKDAARDAAPRDAAAARRSAASDTEDALDTFLNAEGAAAMRRPWARLDRGLRSTCLRAFAASGVVPPADVAPLRRFLLDKLDEKQLNSKQRVVYDPDKGVVLEVRGLKGGAAAGGAAFRLEAVRPTKRRSATAAAAAAVAAHAAAAET